MAEDGLLFSVFARLHTRYHTPWLGSIMLGSVVALATAVLPIDIIGDLVSLGTATAFGIVCFTVIWMRNTAPDHTRTFVVPFGGFVLRGIWVGYVPLLGMVFCGFMAAPLCWEMVLSFMGGDPVPALLLMVYALCGWGCYRFYGRRHSRLAQEHRAALAQDALSH
jgi:APA family basic amino acid/polyamine antiporter